MQIPAPNTSNIAIWWWCTQFPWPSIFFSLIQSCDEKQALYQETPMSSVRPPKMQQEQVN